MATPESIVAALRARGVSPTLDTNDGHVLFWTVHDATHGLDLRLARFDLREIHARLMATGINERMRMESRAHAVAYNVCEATGTTYDKYDVRRIATGSVLRAHRGGQRSLYCIESFRKEIVRDRAVPSCRTLTQMILRMGDL